MRSRQTLLCSAQVATPVNPTRSVITTEPSGWAVVFFLLGIPHVYGVLRQRARRRVTTWWLVTVRIVVTSFWLTVFTEAVYGRSL